MFKEFANDVTNPRSKWRFPKEHRSPVAALYLTVVLGMSKSNQNVRERRHEKTRAYKTQQCTRRVFYFFSTFKEKIISVFRTIPSLKINWLITSLFPLLQPVIGLKNSRYALYQSGAKLKPIACWPLVFFHASGSLLWYFLRSNWPIWFRLRALARLTLPKRGELNMKAIFAVINTTTRRHELCFASAIRILAMRLERSYQHLECDINACKTPSKRKTGKYTQPKPQVPSQMLLVFLPCTCCAANIMLSAKRRWVKRLTQDVLARYPNTACSIARVTCAPATLLTASLVQKNAGRTRRKRKTSRYTPSKPRAS